MPINKENLDRINNLQKTFKDHLLWIGRKSITDIAELVDRVRNILQFTIALSAGIIGITFPQLLTKTLTPLTTDFFLTSLLFFVLNVITGLLSLFTSALKESEQIPILTDHHAQEAIKLINELEEIKKIEINDEAGKRYEELRQRSTLYQMKYLNLIQRIWLKYRDLIIFSLFLWGFIFLIVGLLVNLNF